MSTAKVKHKDNCHHCRSELEMVYSISWTLVLLTNIFCDYTKKQPH